jgi:sulfite reductase (NADPH) flavoprotein alpha-component
MMVLTVDRKAEHPSTSMPTAFSRSNPFLAKVLENINLNGNGYGKETRHIVLSLKGSGLSYLPGDCLGIMPENDYTDIIWLAQVQELLLSVPLFRNVQQ